MSPLWHMSHLALSVGDEIQPGRFGQEVIAAGGQIKKPLPAMLPFFYRECMIEHIRVSRAPNAVSRLSCAFAFESHSVATALAAMFRKSCYEVVAIDPSAPISRHDMAWIAWSGKPGTPATDVVEAIESYWAGTPLEGGDEPRQWERLSSSGLRVLGDA